MYLWKIVHVYPSVPHFLPELLLGTGQTTRIGDHVPSRRERICNELKGNFSRNIKKDLGVSDCQIKQSKGCRLFYLRQLS